MRVLLIIRRCSKIIYHEKIFEIHFVLGGDWWRVWILYV